MQTSFFRDLSQNGPPGVLMAFRAFYDWDVYPSIGGYSKLLDRIVSSMNFS